MESLKIQEMQRDFNDYIDLSKYAEFEVEHKEQTTRLPLPRGNLGRPNLEATREQAAEFARENKHLRR